MNLLEVIHLTADAGRQALTGVEGAVKAEVRIRTNDGAEHPISDIGFDGTKVVLTAGPID